MVPVESAGFLILRSRSLSNLKMIDFPTERFGYLITSDRKPGWVYVLGAFVTSILALGCWMQTASFIGFYDRPTYESLRTHIKQSKAIQQELAQRTKQKPASEPITYLELSPAETEKLEAARKFILSDQELESKLNAQFGTSLKDVHAVIAASWELDDKGYCDVLGITREGGWMDFKEAHQSCSIGATTIRDKPGETQRTIDGTPRIVLNVNALADVRWTRLVIFHELLHAMNIPGYKPTRFAHAQSDLTYLPEYLWFVRKADLWNTDDRCYWCFTIFFLAVFVGDAILLLVRNHRTRQPG